VPSSSLCGSGVAFLTRMLSSVDIFESYRRLGFCEAVAGSRDSKAMRVILIRSNFFPLILGTELFHI